MGLKLSQEKRYGHHNTHSQCNRLGYMTMCIIMDQTGLPVSSHVAQCAKKKNVGKLRLQVMVEKVTLPILSMHFQKKVGLHHWRQPTLSTEAMLHTHTHTHRLHIKLLMPSSKQLGMQKCQTSVRSRRPQKNELRFKWSSNLEFQIGNLGIYLELQHSDLKITDVL